MKKQKDHINITDTKSLVNSGFIDHAFNFWFTDSEHIRSPFPAKIKDELRKNTEGLFFEWVFNLTDKDKSEITEQEVVEMFETILFNEAIKLVDNEDGKLTILYPFMPRTGDKVNHPQYNTGTIKERQTIVSKENKKILHLTVESDINEQVWDLEFELNA